MVEVEGLEVLEIDEVKVGDIVTVFEGGVFYGIHVLKVEEVGEGYIKGYPVSERDGELKTVKRLVTVRVGENLVIVRGIPKKTLEEIARELIKWKLEKADWWRARDEYERWVVSKYMREWEKNNPPPKNPIEALIEKLKTVKHTA